jgi:hypothetical protein
MESVLAGWSVAGWSVAGWSWSFLTADNARYWLAIC